MANFMRPVVVDGRYPMEAVPRGLCIIINNKTFKKDKNKPGSIAMAERTGSDVDRDTVKKTFEEMLFEVRCHDNLSDKKIMRTMHSAAEMDHSKYDCFACCILSHGTLGSVYGSNGHPVKTRSIMAAFKKHSCPSLSGKPKVFFFQACHVSNPEANQPEEPHEDVDLVSTAERRKGATGGDGKDKDTRLAPVEGDFLLGYSSKPAIADKGSHYIQTLMKMLTNYGGKREILEILNVVNDAMKKLENGSDETSLMKSSLRKELMIAPSPKIENVRVMVVGKTKRGKSSTANTILGEDKFPVNNSFSSQNITSDWQKVTRNGRTIEITEMPIDLHADEAARPLITACPGPHIIILCFRCEQYFTHEDQYAFLTLKKWLGSHFTRYALMVFSGLDTMSGKSAEKILRASYATILRELPSPDRLICINNAADWESRIRQGDRILRMADRIVQDNGGSYFTNKKIRTFEEEVQYQLSHGRKRDDVNKRVVAGEDVDLIFAKHCCSVM